MSILASHSLGSAAQKISHPMSLGSLRLLYIESTTGVRFRDKSSERILKHFLIKLALRTSKICVCSNHEFANVSIANLNVASQEQINIWMCISWYTIIFNNFRTEMQGVYERALEQMWYIRQGNAAIISSPVARSTRSVLVAAVNIGGVDWLVKQWYQKRTPGTELWTLTLSFIESHFALVWGYIAKSYFPENFG